MNGKETADNSQEELAVQRRVRKLIDVFADGNQSEFARMIRKSPAQLGNFLQGRNGLPNWWMQSILDAAPGVTADWIMFGDTRALTRERYEKLVPAANSNDKKKSNHRRG